MKIAPSLLAADFSALSDSVSKIESSADFLHLDVMDGHFVPNISFGPGVIAALRPLSEYFIWNAGYPCYKSMYRPYF